MKKVLIALCLITGILISSTGGNEFVAKAVDFTAHSLKNPQMSGRVSTWDCIYFGNYYQSDKAGKKKEPIKWRVLSTDGNEALLLSDYVLDIRQYVEVDDKWVDATWETSSLRTWLNNDFMKTAFSSEDKEGIKTTMVVTPDNKNHGTIGGNNTEDKVYIPSNQDMKNSAYGFSETWVEQSETRLANKTKYFLAQCDFIRNNKKNDYNSEGEGTPMMCTSAYVLRTPGSSQNFISFIDNRDEHGRGNATGNATNDYYAVRPMLRIDLTKESLWKYAGTVNSKGKIVEYQYSSKGTSDEKVVIVKKTENLSSGKKIRTPKIKKVSNAGNYKIKITVNKVSGATGYEYRYSTSKKMRKAKIKPSKKTSYTTKKLKRCKKYYVTVRAYKTAHGKKSYSSWSKVKFIKTSKKSVRKPKSPSSK